MGFLFPWNHFPCLCKRSIALESRQQRIVDDLAEIFDGDLCFDNISRAMYASDASLYELMPTGVLYPRHAEDVVTVARYAEEHNLPITARGAGTGLAGGAIGTGLIVDFSRYMKSIETLSDDLVRVQPGVVRSELNDFLRPMGRYFAPDPSNSAITTVGGMLGVDAAGSHAVRVGSTRDHVRSMELILAGGHRLEAGQEPRQDIVSRTGRTIDDEVKRTIVSRLTKLLDDNDALIREKQPPLIRNCAGYFLRGVLSEDSVNLPRLLVGSEGTLGLFTAATLHTAPLPPHRGVCLLLFNSLDAALKVVQTISEQQPSACDLLGRRLLSLGREADPQFAQLIPAAAETALIIEQTGYTQEQARDRLRMVIGAARAIDHGLFVARETCVPAEVDHLWTLPQRVVPNLIRLLGKTRPQPFVEDMAVPPEALVDFLRSAQKVLQKHKVTSSLYVHAASGQVHLRPFMSVPTAPDGPRYEAIARELYAAVHAVGGTISGEHGDGLSRTSFLRSQYGDLYRAFREVKDIFDPHNLMNPGKIISDDAHLTAKNFRTLPSSLTSEIAPAPGSGSDSHSLLPEEDSIFGADDTPDLLSLQLVWSEQEMSDAVMRCNGCGECRTTSHASRMCPLFHLDSLEDASPRAKANVVRNLLSGQLAATQWSSHELKQVADLCINCKQCERECPSNVDIPHLMIEAKAQAVAANGLKRTDWILSRAHSFGRLGCAAAPVSNWLLGRHSVRWLVEKIFGIARSRKLPAFVRRPFLKQRHESPHLEQTKEPPVVYFVDHFVNYHDVQLGEAFLKILQYNEIPYVVPRGQRTSGMAMITAGDLDPARTLAEINVQELGQYAREGSPIICTEPAARLCLQEEYPHLIDHPDVAVVAAQTMDAGEFLLRLHNEGRLKLGFKSIITDASYHTPCHSRSLQQKSPYLALLKLIPGLRTKDLHLGCSGMGGTFGLTKENFQASLAIGRDLLDHMSSGIAGLGITECSSCRLQMMQESSVPTVHPLLLLAYSYGLMPDIERRLHPGSRKRLIV